MDKSLVFPFYNKRTISILQSKQERRITVSKQYEFSRLNSEQYRAKQKRGKSKQSISVANVFF